MTVTTATTTVTSLQFGRGDNPLPLVPGGSANTNTQLLYTEKHARFSLYMLLSSVKVFRDAHIENSNFVQE